MSEMTQCTAGCASAAQQAAEKALKAICVYEDTLTFLTHNTERLR